MAEACAGDSRDADRRAHACLIDVKAAGRKRFNEALRNREFLDGGLAADEYRRHFAGSRLEWVHCHGAPSP